MKFAITSDECNSSLRAATHWLVMVNTVAKVEHVQLVHFVESRRFLSPEVKIKVWTLAIAPLT